MKISNPFKPLKDKILTLIHNICEFILSVEICLGGGGECLTFIFFLHVILNFSKVYVLITVCCWDFGDFEKKGRDGTVARNLLINLISDNISFISLNGTPI